MRAVPFARRVALVLSLAGLLAAAPVHAGTPAAAAPALEAEVDARDLPRRLLHADIKVPCRPGPLKLWYPKWIPGTHAQQGPLANIGGLRIETPAGKPLRWQRDEVELYCV